MSSLHLNSGKPASVSPTDTSGACDNGPVRIYRVRHSGKLPSSALPGQSRSHLQTRNGMVFPRLSLLEPVCTQVLWVFNRLSLLGQPPIGWLSHLDLQGAFRPTRVFFARREKAVSPHHPIRQKRTRHSSPCLKARGLLARVVEAGSIFLCPK